MKSINFISGIQNPLAEYEHANWSHSKVNIIYIPFPFSNISNWYLSDPQLKTYYRTFIVPDKVTLNAIPVRRIPQYISDLKKELKTIRVEKIVKNSINHPVIVDLSPVANAFWSLTQGRGIKYTASSFFNFVNEIYTMLTSSKQLGAHETVVVFDFKNEYNELNKLLLYLKLNDYKIPAQIADRYVLFHYNNTFRVLTTESSMEIEKPVFNIISKFTNKTSAAAAVSTNSTNDQPIVADLKEFISDDTIKSVLKSKFNKNIEDKLELDSIVVLVKRFINQHPDMDVNLGDPNELANLIKESLKNEIKTTSDKPVSFDELLEEHRKQFVFKKNIDASKMHNKKVIGVNAIAATDVKWITDSSRTRIEFDENLDKNVEKLIESLDDKDFKMQILGVAKNVQDDGRSRFSIYKIKIKPDNGKTYYATLKIPSLVNGTYFKIGGNLYAINNQLMQLPIIKKDPSTVQLKTNYSVTNYSIKAFPNTVSDMKDFVNKFINIMKSVKKLKSAEVMDQATELRLKEYGVPVNAISTLNYKKIEIK